MTPKQAVAFINSQTTCAQAELLAMIAKNEERKENGEAPAYDADAFRKVPEDFGITYNQVIGFFHAINDANHR